MNKEELYNKIDSDEDLSDKEKRDIYFSEILEDEES